MYIGHITYDDIKNPWCGGGGAKRVFEVDRRIAKKHRIKSFTGKFPGSKDEIIDSVEFIRIGFGFNYIVSRISFSLFIPFYIIKEKFDIVVNEFSAYSPSFFFSRKCKNIIAIHHLVGKSPIKKYKIVGLFPYFFEKIAGIYYRYIITVSPSVNEMIKKRYKEGKIYRLIYNGVSNKLFSVSPEEDNYIAFLGRIDVYMKGLDTLFEAFSKIKNKDVKLRLAGSGKEKDLQILKTLSEKLGIRDRVEFLGRISDHEKMEFLGRALFVVMPSRFEGWGIVAIESSACAKAVIGTNIPGLKDAIIHNKTGILVEPDRSDLLAQEMERLLDNKQQRLRLGNNGRNWAKNFDWDKIAEEHEKFYLEVLKNNN
ncbi:MAG: glycosyltransferase family 4 protein [Candidatus Helarchaeota archaeon]|nr:glycosyltransferase family 4 protein [Candidatus Helarchaeota archaeon]